MDSYTFLTFDNSENRLFQKSSLWFSEIFELHLTVRLGLFYLPCEQPAQLPLALPWRGKTHTVPVIKAELTLETSREFLAVTPGAEITSMADDTLQAVAHARVWVTYRPLGSFLVVVTC